VIDYMPIIALRTPADVGALIKDRRRELRLDQADLANLIGVSRLWVNQVERGKPGANLGHILRALAAVGVELIGDVPANQTGTNESMANVSPDINAIVAAARRKDRP
jgi:y4mF family transcriptional regulator